MAKKRRTRSMMKSTLSDSLRQYLETGNYLTRETFPDCPGRAETFQLANPSCRDRLRKVWDLHRLEILRAWKAKKRRGQPWAEQIFNEKKEVQ